MDGLMLRVCGVKIPKSYDNFGFDSEKVMTYLENKGFHTCLGDAVVDRLGANVAQNNDVLKKKSANC